MKTSVDVPVSYRKALAGIDYTSPVCKINVAVNKIPNFLANPNTSPDSIEPHHRCTIHLNCENSEMIEEAYQVITERNFLKERTCTRIKIVAKKEQYNYNNNNELLLNCCRV